MNTFINKIAYSLSLVFLLNWQMSWGQSIQGDTIYVNEEAEIGIKFPTRPSSFYTTPSSAPYNLASLPPSGFTISAKAANTPNALLFVTEGSNSHQFILAFKKDIDYNNVQELFFDYSTKAKLEQRIRVLADRKKVATAPAQPSATGTQSHTSVAQNNTDEAYKTAMEAGGRNTDLELFDQARINFETAIQLKPNETLPRQKLAEVNKRLESSGLNESGKSQEYSKLTGQGKALFDLKEYARSKEAYEKALKLRPADLYSLNQIEKINKVLNSQKSVEEERRLKQLYSSYMLEGDKALAKNLLPEARIAFEQALTIKPNDPAATAKIKALGEKEKREKESQDSESNYLSLVETADKLYLQRDYINAKAGYNKALVLFKRPWPKEQIDNINKILADQEAEKLSLQQQQLKQAEVEKQERAARELEDRYTVVIQKADKLFGQGDYAGAKVEYANAIRIINRPWPNEQIETIKLKQQEASQAALDERQKAETEKKEREQQELEDRYATIIKSADKYFLDSNYTDALAEYKRAKTVLKRPWPDEQIAKINNIVAERAAAEKAERTRREKEIRVTTQYNGLIQKADAEFDKSNYVKARQLYGDASLLKPEEQYPVERLQVIQNALDLISKAAKERADSIAAANELTKKYNLAASRGKSFYQKGDFENAKLAYEEAVALKPAEPESIKQLEKVNNKLEEIEREKALNARYDALMRAADSLLIIKEYEEALASFKEASALKPAETYASKQINYIQKEIINKANSDSLERYRQKQSRYRVAIRNADQALAEKNFSDAVAGYTEALAINPGNETLKRGLTIASYQYDQQKARYEKEQEQLKMSVRQLPLTTKKKKKKDKTPPVQKPLNPYKLDELDNKYPAINFASFPSKQPMNTDATHITVLQSNAQKVFLDKPRLDLSVSDQAINLVCQGIFFKDNMSSLRFLIQNNGQSDFLTGAMMLTWSKAIGARVRLYPIFLYPSFLPVIKPGEEAIVVYVCKSYLIDDADNLEFGLSDRLEKAKLTLNVPGKVYNAEKKKR